MKRILVFLASLQISLIVGFAPAISAEIRVDSNNDSGPGSLRQAVLDANASAGAVDTILIRVASPIQLSAPIYITSNLTIVGEEGPLVHSIAANGAIPLFTVTSGANVTLSRLTLSGARTSGNGAAVNSAGSLSINNMRFIDNHANGDGGAIYQMGGSLVVDRSFFMSNSADGSGGAIALADTIATISSTGFGGMDEFGDFRGNSVVCPDSFDATDPHGRGGAISGSDSTLHVFSSTFTHNLACYSGGAIFLEGGEGTGVNLTLIKNELIDGSAAHIEADLFTLADSVVEEKLDSGTGERASGFVGGIVYEGANLLGLYSELGLGILGDYGGVSPTYPVKPGSRAIDASSSGLLPPSGRDQRGLSRFSDGDGSGEAPQVADLGAFEIQHYVVSANQIRGSSTGGADDVGYGNPFDPSDDADSIASADVFALLTASGKADIGDAIGANNAAGGGSISFTVEGRIALKGRGLEVRRDVAVYGPGAERLSIDGDGRSSVVLVSEGANAFLKNITIEDGMATTGAGIHVSSESHIELEAVAINANRATSDGGGIAVLDNSRAYIFRSSFEGNTAGSRGGAIFSSLLNGAPAEEAGFKVNIDNSTLSNNSAAGAGGAIFSASPLLIDSVAIVGNSTSPSKSGIVMDGSGASIVFANSLLVRNGVDPILATAGASAQSEGHNISDVEEDSFDSALADKTIPEANLGLGPLATNGSGTKSYALLKGSPAINTGGTIPPPPAFDQPGDLRIRGSVNGEPAIDVGPVEYPHDNPIFDAAVDDEEITFPSNLYVECFGGAGATIELNFFVGDPDGDETTVSWSFFGGEIEESIVIPARISPPIEFTPISFSIPVADPASIIVLYATDAFSETTGTVSITVLADTTPPSIDGLTVDGLEFDGEAVEIIRDEVDCSALATFSVDATDACDATLDVVYDVLPGQTFSVGDEVEFDFGAVASNTETTVNFTVTDDAGLETSGFFSVVVKDVTPPAVTVVTVGEEGIEQDNDGNYIVYRASDSCSAPLNFSVTAEDCDTGIFITFDQLEDSVANGALANLDFGDLPNDTPQEVSFFASDSSGNDSLPQSFSVVVKDVTPPTIELVSLFKNNLLVEADPIDGSFTVDIDSGFCSAELDFAVIASDNCIEPNNPITISYDLLPGKTFSSQEEVSFKFIPTVDSGGNPLPVTANFVATDASGNEQAGSFTINFNDPNGSCIFNVAWPNALDLDTHPEVERAFDSQAISQYVSQLDQSRWFKFEASPDSRLIITLKAIDPETGEFKPQLPANYDIVVYKDIQAEFLRLIDLYKQGGDERDLSLIGAEFAPDSFSPDSFSPDSFSPEKFSPDSFSPDSFSPDSFSPDSFSPDSFSPDSFSPDSFSPDSFSPDSFSPDSFSPDSFSPDSFSPDSFSPDSFSPDSFSPDSFSPDSFSSAQLTSMVGFSAFPGVANEGISLNTFTSSGTFFVRVRGYNGAFSNECPFKIEVRIIEGLCSDVATAETLEERYAQEAGGAELDLDFSNYVPAIPVGWPVADPKTLIIMDSTRISDSGLLTTELEEFAQRPEVQGVIVDVGQIDRVFAANFLADQPQYLSCFGVKNLVAEEIKTVIDAWRSAYANLEYIQILGDDDVIPFFRERDESFLANESSYIPPVKDKTHSQASLRTGRMLTQDPYGAACVINLATGPYHYPEIAVGRLVESTADILGQLQNYNSKWNGVETSPITPIDGIVTGYDFLYDVAQEVSNQFDVALNGQVDSELITDGMLSPEDPASWTASQLKSKFFDFDYDLWFLAGHFATGSTLAADYKTRLTAKELDVPEVDLTDALILSVGCHSGYSTVDGHAIFGITPQPDWAQLFAKKRATLIAGTGYQYGDTEFIEYSERLYLEIIKQLRRAPADPSDGYMPIGKALVRAKQLYLADTPIMRGIHEKSLVQVTLYGFPMLRISLPGPVNTESATAPRPYDWNTPQPVVSGPGSELGLKIENVLISSVETNGFDLTGRAPVAMTVIGTDPVEYVDANSFIGKDGVVSNPVEPVLPVAAYDISDDSVDFTLLRGVGFRGGRYTDVPDYLPLTGAPTTEIRGIYGTFYTKVFFPVMPFDYNHFGRLCGGTDGERLNLFPTQYLSNTDDLAPGEIRTGTLRKYSDLDFRLYYNEYQGEATITTGPSAGATLYPALAPPPTIGHVLATESDASSIDIQVSVTGSPLVGVQEVWITYTEGPDAGGNGEWTSVNLVQDSNASTKWTATLNGVDPEKVQFVVQAATGNGLVTLNSNRGEYFGVVDPTQFTVGTSIELNGPDTGAYGDTITVTASLSFSDGTTVPAGTEIGVRLGSKRVTKKTVGTTGSAVIDLPLDVPPSDQNAFLLQAFFQGDGVYSPSADSSEFTVTKQGTRLAFVDPPQEPTSGSGIVLELQDGLASPTPLKERGIYVIADYFPYVESDDPAVIVNQLGPEDIGHSVITNFSGRANLGDAFLPEGTARITAYFGDIILPPSTGLPASERLLTVVDSLYEGSVSNTVEFLIFDESLVFEPQQVDVYYKSSGKGNNATGPTYKNASISGGLAFGASVQPEDLLEFDDGDGLIEARVEAMLAGQVIASEMVLLDTRGGGPNHWTTASLPGSNVSYVGIHWSEAPRFDTILSSSPGPRIYTTFIGNSFTEFRYKLVPGKTNYSTTFPGGVSINVKQNGSIETAGIAAGDLSIDETEGVIAFGAKFGLKPGMTITTTGLNSSPIAVLVQNGLNYLIEGGKLIVRLEAVNGVAAILSSAEPNVFECRILIGNEGPGIGGEEQIQVKSIARIGDGAYTTPWSSETAGHKQYRP